MLKHEGPLRAKYRRSRRAPRGQEHKKPQDGYSNLRYYAGKNARRLPTTAPALSHSNAEVRLEAAACLTEIDVKHANEILPVIRRTLDGEPKVELPEGDVPFGMALDLCVMLGADASPLLPRLLEINRTQKNHFAILAGQAAVAIDKDHIPEVGKNFAMLLSQARPLTSDQFGLAHRLLREWGKSAVGADEYLVVPMKQNRNYARYDFAATLILLQGPNATKGVEQMRRGLRNTSSDSDCRDALRQFIVLKSQGKDFLPELRLLLDSPNEDHREKAVQAIGAIGQGAKELVPELRRRLEDPHSDAMRRHLDDAIKSIS